MQWRLSTWSALCEALIHMAVSASIILGLWYGAVLVLEGTMTPGSLVSYILFAVDIVVYLGIFPALGALVAKVRPTVCDPARERERNNQEARFGGRGSCGTQSSG